MNEPEANNSSQKSNDYRLLNYIPLNSGSILELGTNRLNLERSFLHRNPHATWTSSERALQVGGEQRHHVIVLKRSGYELDQFVSVLDWLPSLLEPDGVLVLELANPFHWRELFLMLGGKDTMKLSGRASGLALFSPTELEAAFARAGLTLRKIHAIKVGMPSVLIELSGTIARLPEWSGQIEADVLRSRLEQESLILVGTRHPKAQVSGTVLAPVRPRLVIAMLAMAPGFADVRTRLPLASFSSCPDVEVIYLEKQGQLPNLPPDQPKVLVVQRQLPDSEQSWRTVVDRLRKKGWVVIAEWDDHPDLFAPPIRAKFDAAPWASVIVADAVQTSTVALADVMKKITKRPIEIFDNRLLEVSPYTERLKSELVRVFISGLNRTTEFLSLFEQLNDLQWLLNQIEFFVVQDQAVYEVIKSSRKKFLKQLSYVEYHRVLDECDIALMPLNDSLGNRCKSDLKWVECASHGLACIGSKVVYGETIRHRIDGLISDSISDFPEHLRTLIDNPSLISKYGNAARQRVLEERLLSQVLEKRIEWYLSVWHSVFSKTHG